MAIYLVQHGKSLPEDVDPQRHLSPEGEREVREMAAWAQRVGLKVQRVVHSGKERAQQSAEIFAAALLPLDGVEQMAGLAPLDDPTSWPEWLSTHDGTMIVGHLPFLARLVALMLAGTPERKVVQFDYAGIVCLERAENGIGWTLTWAVWPNLVL